MNVVETRGLAKAYRGRRVVDRFDMRVAQGDIYGFVGKNGAGKSTVMKMICGLVAPTAGEIELFGSRMGGDARAAAGEGAAAGGGGAFGRGWDAPGAPRIGALIEAPGLLPNLTAFQNLMVKALAMGIVDAAERSREMLELVGLPEAGKKKVKGFSLGMKQRLGLALALVGSPDLLLLDEPLNGLDPEGTRAVRNLLVRLNQSFGITIVISSHVLDQLDRVATRFGVIADGTLVREMTAEEMQSECGDSLRVRTTDPARTLALLDEAFPQAVLRAQPDGTLSISGRCEPEAVSRLLRDTDQTVLELGVVRCDIEDYFLELMEGTSAGRGPIRGAAAPAPRAQGGGPRV